MGDAKLLEALKEERAGVVDAISKLQARLDALDSSITRLEPFYSGPYPNLRFLSDMAIATVPVGITEAIRDVFQSATPNSYLAPTEVRDRLKAAGLMKGYPNEMAVVHQVIRRLQYQGQIEAHPSDKIHRWIRPAEGILRRAAERNRDKKK